MIVTIQNWKKYNPRPDVERPSWFRLEADLLMKPENLTRFGPHEILAIIYLCSLALLNRSATFTVIQPHAELFSRLTWSQLGGAVKKLEQEGVVTVAVTPMLRYETRRDETGIQQPADTEVQPPLFNAQSQEKQEPVKEELPKLAQIWNKHAAHCLARVLRCSPKRRKKFEKAWKSDPTEKFWISVIDKVNASSFLCGKIKGKTWKANLDFVAEEQNVDWILEGKYDDRAENGGSKSAWALQQEAERG